MRALCVVFLLLFSLPSLADGHLQLYQAAGWPQQRVQFNDALSAAQQRYRSSLPPVYQALLDNSNLRFDPRAMDQRAQRSLRDNLADPAPALRFFQSPLGRKVVAAELLATRREQLQQHADGLPRVEASATRRLLIRHLAQALPAKEAGAEVSLALAVAGQAYYQAALAAIRAGLAVGQSTSSLAPAPQGI